MKIIKTRLRSDRLLKNIDPGAYCNTVDTTNNCHTFVSRSGTGYGKTRGSNFASVSASAITWPRELAGGPAEVEA